MTNDNKFLTDKPLYNHSIEFDISNLPKYIIETIKELEQYDKIGDWVSYDMKFDELEVYAKSFLNNNKISENDYNKILKKYGGLL